MNAAPVSRSRFQIGRLWGHRVLLSLLAVIALFAMVVMPFGSAARATVPDPLPVANEVPGPNTEIQLVSQGPGLNLRGFAPSTPRTQDPTAAYPITNPTTGYSTLNAWAGTIITESVADPDLFAEMYCINLRVPTRGGVGYESGTWEESNVPNIGYVTYILNNYYPTTTQPAGLTDDQRAAAVQAAIWYFTDGYVVATAPGPLRAAVAAIVQDAQANGPVAEPPAPDITITPTTAEAPVGGAAGPFVVAAEGAVEVTVSVPRGYSMFTDATATTPLANPSAVPSGTSIWVTSTATTANETTLSARAAVTVQRGQVYLYDGNDPTLTDAQRLILADTTELEAVAQATPSFFAIGSLTVNKTFAGDAIGQQGPIQLLVNCGDGYSYTADIPANSTATQTFTYPGIPVGNTCTVTEPTTGSTTTVEVTTNAPQGATIDADGETVTITNTVTTRPGGLNVTKVITGEAAGSQEDIVLSIDCGTALTDTFTIPAGSTANSYVRSYTDLPAGTSCTVTETATGESSTVVVDPTENVTVTIAPGATSDATITNTATFQPGGLRVTKVVTGEAAGLQGEIVLQVSCGEALSETVTIPAGATADSYVQTFNNIPANTECTVTETETGTTQTALVVPTEDVTVTVTPGTIVDATITNTVTNQPGSLNVTKVITGDAAGSQEDIVLTIDCGEALSETFTIPAGSTADSYVQSYTDLPAGTECTITETETGESSTVVVDPTEDVTVTIEPGATAEATITNTVTFRPGVLNVTKVITGEAAGSQEDIVLTIDCGEALSETFTIPAGSTADSYVQTYEGLPSGTECTITETETGESSTVVVDPTEDVTVTIPPGEGAEATITNTVTFRPGVLNVTKVITGEAAGSQEDIVLTIDCGEALSETFTIPAGSTADSYVQSYEDLPSGTECTITETETGESSTVVVDPTEDVTVTIEPGATATAEITNTVTFRPGALNVTKVITGEAAGSQEDIVLTIDCGEALSETFTIPAGSTADSYVQSYEDLPAGTECTVTETETGESSTVVVDPTEDVTVTIEPGATAEATITNTVTFQPGALQVRKVLTGEGAGSQEDIVLDIDCGEALTETITIPAGSTAGSYVQTFSDLPAGTECSVTETETGESSTVVVDPTEDVTVTIEPGATAEAVITNTVTFQPGSLSVTKVITGDAAGLQGEIVLEIDCGEALTDTVTIPAGATADSYVETFDNIPANTECTVTETETGSTDTVLVEATDNVTVTIAPGATVDATITNTVDYQPGGLRVTKVITGGAAGLQGEIVLEIDCGEALTDTFSLPAGSTADSYIQIFQGIPAGTECTVTESASGSTGAIQVEATDAVTVTVASGAFVDATITNTVTREETPGGGGGGGGSYLPTTGSNPGMLLLIAGGVIAGGLAIVLIRGAAVRRRESVRRNS